MEETEKLYQQLADTIRPLASKEKKTRTESIALTHMETALLWIGAQLQAERMSKPA